MFRNMAVSLIRSVRPDEDDDQKPKVPGRIVTTLPKAKELRPIVEKLVTLAKQARPHEERAAEFRTNAERHSDEYKSWVGSEQWQRWSQAMAPAVTARRRAFAELRDKEAVSILFDELASRFEDRPGGYTRVVRLPAFRLGDAGQQAIIEFVGERDRPKATRRRAPVVAEEETSPIGRGTAEEETTGAEQTAPEQAAGEQPEASAGEGEERA